MLVVCLVALAALYLLHRNRSNQSRGWWPAFGFGFALAVLPAVATAATPVGPDAQVDSAFNLDPFTVSLIFGTLIPIVGGILLKHSTSGNVKVLVNLLLSAVASIINISATEGGGAVISEQTLKSAALTFIVSVATLYGVWKPAGVDHTLKANVGLTDRG